MAQIVEAARRGRLAGLQPGLARLAALPGFGGEAQNLDLDAAALQRAGENVGAGRRDGDRPPAHRAGIVEQQRHHRVAEVRVLFALEGERLLRVDDDALQPRRIENAFLKVEFPRAVLLRQQTALQPVGEPADDGGEVLQLLVEIGTQPLELFRLAERFGGDGLVEFMGEGLIIRSAGFRPRPRRRAMCVGRLVALAEIALFLGLEVAGGGIGGLDLGVAIGLGRFARLRLRRIGAFVALAFEGLGIVAPGLLIVALLGLLAGVGADILAHIERREHAADRLAEGALILERASELVEIAPRPLLDERDATDRQCAGRLSAASGQ